MIGSTFWGKTKTESTFWEKPWFPALSGGNYDSQQILGTKMISSTFRGTTWLAAHFGNKTWLAAHSGEKHE
jgi:hypothetical protein